MFPRSLRVVITALCTFLIIGVCIPRADARGVARVHGVGRVGQNWGDARLKIRWSPVPGAKYQMRIATTRSRLKHSRVIHTSASSGTYTPVLSRSRSYYVQARATVRRTKGHWSRPVHVRFARPRARVSVVSSGPSPVSSPAVASTMMLNPVDDAMVVSSAPTTNFGTYDQLSAQAGSTAIETFMRFRLPKTPTGTQLSGATLTLQTASDPTAGSVNAFSIAVGSGSWSQSTVNWNNRPTVVGPEVGTVDGATATDTTYQSAITPSALRSLLGSSVSFRVAGTGEDNLRVMSREAGYAPYRPALRLMFTPLDTVPPVTSTPPPVTSTPPVPPTLDTEAPSVPTTSGATLLGSDATLSWSASTDNVGVVGYSVYRGTDATFTSDSASKLADVTTTSFTDRAMSPGVYYYKVLARDAAGNLSGASATAQVTVPVPAPTPVPAPSSGKKVFAHYFPPYPISYENASTNSDYYANNYLTINGENGIWAFCGGLLRDRPQGRAPLVGSDYLLQDLRTEVRQAKAAGINGFTLDIMGLSGMNWTASVNLMRAARDVGGFEVVPNLDVTAGVASESPSVIATKLAELYSYSSASTIGGEYVLSSFAAEVKQPVWWTELINDLEQTQHLPIKFVAVFLNASDANLNAFAPISYGFGNWGTRTASSIGQTQNYAAKAHALGRKWMEPVAFQDARPRSNVYAEASNTETGRASWRKAIRDDADFVQMVTWNDYSESTQLAPSMAHGSVYLDISKYYIDWFKNGASSPITTDHLFVTHRVHAAAATPTSGIMNMSPTLGGMTTPPRDTVEALVFLTAPADVTVTSGGISSTVSLPAGVSSTTVPLRSGAVSAKIVRGSTTVRTVDSPYRVVSSPVVQDFQYWAAGS